MEPQAFSELLERPKRCDAPSCICLKGRNFSDENNYPLTYCRSCGSIAMHKTCLLDEANFVCDRCIAIVPKDAAYLDSLSECSSDEQDSDSDSVNSVSEDEGTEEESYDEEEDKENLRIYRNEIFSCFDDNYKIKNCFVRVKKCYNIDTDFDTAASQGSAISSCASYTERLPSVTRYLSSDNESSQGGGCSSFESAILKSSGDCIVKIDENSNQSIRKRKIEDDFEDVPAVKELKLNDRVQHVKGYFCFQQF